MTRAHNGKKAINYLFGASHSEGIERNYHITGVNMVSFDSVSPSDQFARYWNRASDRVKVQVIRVTQSFSDKEFHHFHLHHKIARHLASLEKWRSNK